MHKQELIHISALQETAYSHTEIGQLVDLIARASDPSQPLTGLERRQIVAEGLLQIVDADTFFWMVGYANPDQAGDGMPVSFVDGGWRDDAERNRFLHLLTHSPAAQQSAASLTAAVYENRISTIVRREVMPDDVWPVVGKDFHDQGFSEFLMSMYPLGAGGHSTLALYGRVGREPFSTRAGQLVEIVMRNIGWIHRAGGEISAGRTAISLTPREREVLLFLLRGDSQKMIASKLGISHHTVGDYLKQLHRHFNVSSRGELLGRFIGGNKLLD